jgi:hypothetical protein
MQSADPIGESPTAKSIECAAVAHSVILRQDEAFDDSPHPCLRGVESA